MTFSDEPLWIDLWRHFGVPSLMAVSLLLWIRLGRRWIYAYWIIVAVGLTSLAFDVAHEGWKPFLFQDPNSVVTHSETVLEGGRKVARVTVGHMFAGPIDLLDFPAKVADWAVVFLSLSAPFWVNGLRRNLGLKDT